MLTNFFFDLIHTAHISQLVKHENQLISFLWTKEIQANFCMCGLALINCHTCGNPSSKRTIINDKAYNHCTSKLNMVDGRCAHAGLHVIHN